MDIAWLMLGRPGTDAVAERRAAELPGYAKIKSFGELRDGQVPTARDTTVDSVGDLFKR
jgi:hypothetical protein